MRVFADLDHTHDIHQKGMDFTLSHIDERNEIKPVLGKTVLNEKSHLKERDSEIATSIGANAKKSEISDFEGFHIKPEEKEVFEEIWFEATLNQQKNAQTVLVLRDQNNDLFVSEQDLLNWQLSILKQNAIDYLGEKFYPLKALNIEYQFNFQKLTLSLQAPVDIFNRHQLHMYTDKAVSLNEPVTGAFLNYDVEFMHSQSDQQIRGSGLFELAMFNKLGTGASTFLGKYNQFDNSKSWLRLDSYWRKDFPAYLTTLTVGDTLSKGTSWSGGVHFAGVQWGSNFTTRPEFVTLPLMSMSGEAALPSTVELYINDALRFQQDVAPGAFTVNEIPTITGSGVVQLKVRDLLNREQIIQQNFYGNQRLLRVGLNEYAIEVGKIRENYGHTNMDYGRWLTTATWRRGIASYLTLEAHAQILENQNMVGVGVYSLLPWQSVLSMVVANSSTEKNGHFYSVGLQHQGYRFGWGAETRIASKEFTRLGMINNQNAILEQNNMYFSLSGLGNGSFNINYTGQKYSSGFNLKFIGMNYGLPILERAYFQLSTIYFLEKDQTNITVSLSVPFGDRKSTNISVGQIDKQLQSQIQVQRSLPLGEGFGYRLRTNFSDSKQQEAGFSFQNNYFTSQFDVSQMNNQLDMRGNVKGGFAFAAGSSFASRSIDDSFAVVRIPAFPHVRIYRENQEIGKTNAKGFALVSQLRAYEKNNISLQQEDLPLNAKIKNLAMDVYPHYRSGVVLDFPVTVSRQVLLRVLDENEQPIPLGAVVINSHGESFPVGARGEVFLSDLDEQNQLKAQWQNQQCLFHYNFSGIQNDDQLQEVICRVNVQ